MRAGNGPGGGSRAAFRPPGDADVAAGINRLEGYLLLKAEADAARRAAEAFADRLPWLDGPQRAELVDLYTRDRLDRHRRALERLRDRALGLRAEYARRYALLRRRLVCVTLLALPAAMCGAYVLAAAGRGT
ncbi:hypothetical protein ACSNOK_04305 [Streptomyces sp. URMC 126]|uniref:hypothetical protein n=1 Tax=Streptomyces sp. URMC 126 TaxID=3423401 RepID=UPI003F1C9B43